MTVCTGQKSNCQHCRRYLPSDSQKSLPCELSRLLLVFVAHLTDDSFHSVKIPSMFLSKLPVSSFLPAAMSFHEFHQVIIFLFLCFSPSNAFFVFHPVREKEEACMTCVPNASMRACRMRKNQRLQIAACGKRWQRACRTCAALDRNLTALLTFTTRSVCHQ